MNAVLVVTFVGGPILVIAEDDPSAFYFVFCAIIFVICSSLLCFIFVPKILHTASRSSMKNSIQRSSGQAVNNHSMDCSSRSRGNSEVEGPRILSHPKMQDDMKEEILTLRQEKKQLLQRIAKLERKDNGESVSEPIGSQEVRFPDTCPFDDSDVTSIAPDAP